MVDYRKSEAYVQCKADEMCAVRLFKLLDEMDDLGVRCDCLAVFSALVNVYDRISLRLEGGVYRVGWCSGIVLKIEAYLGSRENFIMRNRGRMGADVYGRLLARGFVRSCVEVSGGK